MFLFLSLLKIGWPVPCLEVFRFVGERQVSTPPFVSPLLGFPRFLELLGWTVFHHSRLIVALVKKRQALARNPCCCCWQVNLLYVPSPPYHLNLLRTYEWMNC